MTGGAERFRKMFAPQKDFVKKFEAPSFTDICL